jgi:hypothetical protein
MVQIIKCKCGNIIAAAAEPHCYADAEWQKDMRKYVKKGYTVEMMENGSGWKFESCVCKSKKKNPNQLELF